MLQEAEISKEMLSVISSELEELESVENVRILFAIESGSHAWGFASPDSDYDVRIVYARSPKWYMQLDDQKDVIEWKLDDVLDINGWDIKKALQLMRGSNPSLLEWLSSPIFYRPLVDERILTLAEKSFDPIKSCHHYLSMAKSNMRDHLENETVKLKKYFYVIRPILAAKHVLAKHTQPPMLFEDLANEYLDSELAATVHDFLDMKRNSDETLYIQKCEKLNAWIYSSLNDLEVLAKNLPHTNKLPWDEYNELFLDLVGFNS